MELPTPRSFELGDITGDCAICYAYHLPTCAPVVCAPVWHIRTAGMDTPRRAPCPEGSLAHGGCACRANGNGSSVPEHSCDNEACGRPYHASCLQEWCAPLPHSRHGSRILVVSRDSHRPPPVQHTH